MFNMWVKFLCLLVLVNVRGDEDLMDLYVRHMDETMGNRDNNESTEEPLGVAYHQRGSLSYRGRRSVLESDVYRAVDSVPQAIDQRFFSKGSKKNSLMSSKFKIPKVLSWYETQEEKVTQDQESDLQSLESQVSSENHSKLPSQFLTRSRRSVFNGKFFVRIHRTTPLPWEWKSRSKNHKRRFGHSDRKRRSVVNEPVVHHHHGMFSRLEKLDENGDVVLEWDPDAKENVTFRLTAKTQGYIGLGFNDKSHLKGADIVLAWVDDHTGLPVVIDSHGLEDENAAPETDLSQDLHLVHGTQNDTHTVITFTRSWQTCDPQDRTLTGDTIRVLWALHPTDPELNEARFVGNKRGGRALRLRAPAPHKPPALDNPDIVKWDVKLNQFTVPNTSDTVYWCKLFKAPKLHRKHHMIGYTPLVDPENEAVVHHVILYECASTQPILAELTRLSGAHCYSPTMPKEWDSCLQPVLAWARGSQGEWLPEHVGLPIAEHQEGSYYMLEVHYNNRLGREVVDSSGVRLHLTPNVRKMEAGILVAGIAISPLHMIPPLQKEYATAGYCTPGCTNKMFDKDGINVVSVVLHSHLAGKRLSLKHIRRGKELPPIVQDNQFDFDYQQSHTLGREVKILPGDELVAECVYDTRNRNKPTFGGYAADQEMCLAFVVHYPRTPLAACYSMTPVKEFFHALNVESFKGVSIEKVEKLFLSTTTDTVALPVSPNHHSQIYSDINTNEDLDIIKQTKSALISKGDYIDYDDIFARLVIEKPDEFKDHTLSDHISALAWNDNALSKSIERSLYHGTHVTFCRTREDKLPRAASIQPFPNYTVLPVSNDSRCEAFNAIYGSSSHTFLPGLLFAAIIPLLVAVFA